MASLWGVCIDLLLTAVLISVFSMLLERHCTRMLYRRIREVQAQLIAKLLRLSPFYIDNKGTGYLHARIREDLPQMTSWLAGELAPYVVIALQLAGTVFFLFKIDFYIAGAAILLTLLVTVFNSAISKRLQRLAMSSQEQSAQLSGVLTELIAASNTIRMCNAQQEESRRACEKSGQTIDLWQKLNLANRLIGEINTATGRFGFLVIAIVGAIRIDSGALTAAAFMSSIVYLNILLYSSKSLLNIVPRLAAAMASVERIAEFFALPEEEESFGTKMEGNLAGNLTFDQVSFAYPNQPALFSDLSLEIPYGSKVAIVGPSGAGKSTLVKLALGLLKVTAGDLRIDGKSIYQYDLHFLRSHLGYVAQDDYQLLRRSIKENIMIARNGAKWEEIETAARQAQAHEFITRLEHGYDCIVGEDQNGLSGGERQRIAMARELLRDPSILVIDEATSQLDLITEKAVIDALTKLFSKATCLIVSHRLSAIVDCDLIVVVDRGRIVETGKHDTLMQRRGLYQRLFEAQSRVNEWQASEQNGILLDSAVV